MNQTRITMALNAMEYEAQQMGVKGVASVCVLPKGELGDIVVYQRTCGRYFRPPQPEERGPDDKGTNYLIGSYAKIGESIRTGVPSGTSTKPLLRCELGWRGSTTADSGSAEVHVAFSGGSSEEDLQIAAAGMNALVG